MIDVKDNGFHLTSPAYGVDFDITGDGVKEHLSWTDPKFGNGWLALDLNGNGKIDSGKELFGNLTDHNLADPNERNGFSALSYYDTKEAGGNGDGLIDSRDAVFLKLRVWVDKNQNGISEPGELFTLPELDIQSIDLSYRESKRKDEFGNLFRYAGSMTERGRRAEKIYDVFLHAATLKGGK